MKYLFLIVFTYQSVLGFTQDSLQVIILSEKVGAVIDSTEKKRYRLFPYYSSNDFKSAALFQLSDSTMILRSVMKDGTSKEKNISSDEYWMMKVLLGETKHGGIDYGAGENTKEGVGMSWQERSDERARVRSEKYREDQEWRHLRDSIESTQKAEKKKQRQLSGGNYRIAGGVMMAVPPPIMITYGLFAWWGGSGNKTRRESLAIAENVAKTGAIVMVIGTYLFIRGVIKKYKYKKEQKQKMVAQ